MSEIVVTVATRVKVKETGMGKERKAVRGSRGGEDEGDEFRVLDPLEVEVSTQIHKRKELADIL